MQVLVNQVIIACGLKINPWSKSDKWFQGENFEYYLRLARSSYKNRPNWQRPKEPIFFGYDALTEDDYDQAETLTLYRIERNSKLVHISRTREAALREVAWRDWILGCDGVAIVEMDRKGLTIFGATKNPHRYGAPWPKAKMDEFVRLYQSDMPMKELEEYFDTASSLLGRKRAQSMASDSRRKR